MNAVFESQKIPGDLMPYDVANLLTQLTEAKAQSSKRTRRKLVTKLALSEDPAACAALEEVLGSDTDDFSRALAAKGLGLQHSDAARSALLRYVNDPSSKTRAQVAAALGHHRHPEVYPVLAKLLVEDTDETVRFTAANSLVELGGEPALQGLCAALDHESSPTRRHVVYALVDLGDKAAIPRLEERKAEESRFNRAAFNTAIERLG